MITFFYGLFMDVDILAKQAIAPESFRIGWVHDFAIRIGERATLVPHKGGQVYGTLMDISSLKVTALYEEKSVADYIPEKLRVVAEDGVEVEAMCYNLPPAKIAGENKEYAKKLLEVAETLGFPASYTQHIKQASL